jgi:hypothetical protein
MFAKRISLAASTCALLAFVALCPTDVLAQSPEDGPFSSAAELQSYWAAQHGGHGMQIVLDGTPVYSRFGFGPYLYAAYFTCPGEGLIRRNCPTEGPFANIDGVIGYWSQVPGAHAMAIYVSGQLVYSRYGFGPAFYKAYTSCNNRPGLLTNCAL